MHRAMEQLASLPPDTVVYCGHEYTLSNLKFAMTIEPDNMHLKKKVGICVSCRSWVKLSFTTTDCPRTVAVGTVDWLLGFLIVLAIHTDGMGGATARA